MMERNNITKQQVPSADDLLIRFPFRLKQAISRVGSVKKLHEMTSIPIRTLQDWEAGKTEPKISRVAQIAIACGVSLDWLITGTGEMVLDASTNWDTTQVPKYAISASAGNGSIINFEEIIENIPVSTVKLHRLNIQPNLAFFIDVIGDSMEPLIPDRATVLAERMNEYTHVLNGVYLFRLDGELYVKYLERGNHFPDTIIRSENPSYEPRFIRPNKAATSLEVVARVILQ